MNEKSNENLTSIGMPKENFSKMLETQERKSSFEDKALEKFVRKPKKSNLYDKVVSTSGFMVLFLLFCIICVLSVASGTTGNAEPAVACIIALLSLLGIIILAKEAKISQDENNSKYK